jgi:hypothetical protein
MIFLIFLFCMSLKRDEGSDMSDDGLRLDNLLSTGQKYPTSSDIRIFIFVILNFQNTRLMIQYPALLRGIVN